MSTDPHEPDVAATPPLAVSGVPGGQNAGQAAAAVRRQDAEATTRRQAAALSPSTQGSPRCRATQANRTAAGDAGREGGPERRQTGGAEHAWLPHARCAGGDLFTGSGEVAYAWPPPGP